MKHVRTWWSHSRTKLIINDDYFHSLASLSHYNLAPTNISYNENMGRYELYVYRMIGMIFGLSLMTTIGTARFSELVTGIQVFSLDPNVQNKINDNINQAGLEVFNEIMLGAFIFSLLASFSALILSYVYIKN